jgi:tetratricopeptide (TPR) repeat protein
LRLKPIAIAFSALIAFNCSTLETVNRDPVNDQNIPEKFEIRSVPFFEQEAYRCGPAVLAMALSWAGERAAPDALTPEIFTPALKGTLQTALIGAARRHGKIGYPIYRMDSLLKELAAGHPVIVLQNLGISWLPKWHYSLAVGYDMTENLIVLHSGKTERKLMPWKVFEKTWARSGYWGLLVLPPDLLPATAEAEKYISSIIGLEKAQRWREALRAYITALNKWPENYVAQIGLGNCYYYMGDLKSSEDVFRSIIFRFPDKGAAYNNLAQVLSDRGKYTEAFNSIQTAIRIDGAAVKEYQRTLEEIQTKRSFR